eukprot:gene17892-biopygen14441
MGPFASERGYTCRCGALFKPLLNAVERCGRCGRPTGAGISVGLTRPPTRFLPERCGRCGRPAGAGISVGLTRSATRFLPGFASKMLQRVTK